MNKKVIIYTQAYNAESTLRRAVDSILAQDFCGMQPEYILVDNGSTDGTAAIIAEISRRYPWIHPLYMDVNMRISNTLLDMALSRYQKDDYFISLDADDEYHPDFFRDVYRFMTEEQLDIATCGVSLVSETGELQGVRQLPQDTTWARDNYPEGFIQFRRFFMELWGKIFRLPEIQKSIRAFHTTEVGVDWDYMVVLDALGRTKRIGVLSRSLHSYYSSPTQLSKVSCTEEDVQILPKKIRWLYHWLTQFGPISRLNEDYLAAIYLGWCENLTGLLMNDASLTNDKKTEQIHALLSLPETISVLTRTGCDPQFRNLANRGAFLERIRTIVPDLGRALETVSDAHQRT